MASAINNISMSDGTNIVTIGVTKSEKTMANAITNFTIPKLEEGGKAGSTMIINLRRVEKRYNVDGYLVSGLGTGDTHWEAQDKEADLETMFGDGNVLNMTWIDGTEVGIMMDKLTSEHITSDGFSAAEGEAEFVIKFTALAGTSIL